MKLATFTYEQERELMVQYLLLKLSKNDMHGVADAAMDIRELDAAEVMRKSIQVNQP